MGKINKEVALDIVSKLKGELKKKTKAHDYYEVYNDGVLITEIGIRRGSNKDLGHDHVPHQIFVSPHDARLIGVCPLTRKDWIQKLRDKNMM